MQHTCLRKLIIIYSEIKFIYLSYIKIDVLFFTENDALWLYFYGPMGLLLLGNLGLFIYTSFRIVILKRGTGALRQADSAQHGNRKNQQR